MSNNLARLSPETAHQYATLRARVIGAHGPDADARFTRYTQRLNEDESFAKRIHVLTARSEPCALAGIMGAPLSSGEWQTILDWSTEPSHEDTILATLPGLLAAWLQDLRGLEEPPRELTMRLNLDRAFPGLEDVFASAGWIRRKERYEFKTPVENLPTDWEGPLEWRDLERVGADLFASVIDEAGPGPEWEEEDHGAKVLADCLSDEDLTCDPSCAEIGFTRAGEPAAFIIAQTAPDDGWCTISFMGVVSAMRGRGLGAWVHRRGFELMRRQGGLLYHGGTSATNKRMLSLFDRHGCEHHARLSEWSYDLRPA